MKLPRVLSSLTGQLQQFVQNGGWNIASLNSIFGDRIDAATLEQLGETLIVGNLGGLPVVETLPQAQMGTAVGAYAPELDRILISQEFLDTASDQAVMAVLLEEFGHAIDARLNGGGDAPGDEGALFSALVRGESLTAAQVAQIQGEDDTATISLGGQTVVVEQSDTTDVNGTLTTAIDLGVISPRDLGTFATPSTSGVAIGNDSNPSGGFAIAGDVDLYRLELTSRGTFTVNTAPSDGLQEMDTVLRLFDANGQQLAYNDDWDALYSRVTTELDAGVYYVGVSGYLNRYYDPQFLSGSSYGRTGFYDLQIGFESVESPFSVAENSLVVGNFSAPELSGEGLTHSLSGPDAGLFDLDSTTGELAFKTAPDYETPGDNNGDNTYNVTVTTSNGGESVSQSWAIAVTDAEESPFSVAENSLVVGNFSAPELSGESLTHSLSGPDAGLFDLDSTTGELAFKTAPDYETPGDNNGDNTYNVTVTTSNGGESVSQSWAIAVTDAEESPFSVAENSLVVGNFSAPELSGEGLTHSLSGQDAGLFDLDSTTGELTFKTAPDYETPGDNNGDNTYDVTVTTSNGGESVSQSWAIAVTDAEESPFSVAENSLVVGNFSAPELSGESLTHSLSGPDAGLFDIDITTGELTFKTAPDYETPGDNNGDNTYNVTVTTSNGGESVSQSWAIAVSNVRDVAPVITSLGSFPVVENTILAGQVTATDVEGDSLTYSLSGTDAALFNIDGNTGAITFQNSPDYEAPGDGDGNNTYEVVVTATDGVMSTSQSLAIAVNNVKDVAPVITSVTTFEMAENSTAVGQITGTDVEGDTIYYSIANGADRDLFTIDESTGP